jgi:hypothetical protein
MGFLLSGKAGNGSGREYTLCDQKAIKEMSVYAAFTVG